MIRFFMNLEECNAFFDAHPEYETIGLTGGHVGGSLIVMYRQSRSEQLEQADSGVSQWSPSIPAPPNGYKVSDLQNNEPEIFKPRRGRRPKVKDA